MSLILGIVLGLVSSFLGIGGGVFLVPLLPKIYELTAHEAVVLSLSFIFVSVLINTAQYQLQKKIVWSLVLKMAPFIIIGGFAGSKVASFIPGIYLRLFLAIFLVLMSLSFLKTILTFNSNKNRSNFIANLHPYFLGVFSGILSGFAGVGSGVFLNWLVLNNKSVNSKEEAPTVNAMMIFVCLGVFVSAFLFNPSLAAKFYDKVGLQSFLLMIIGIVIGSYVGKTLNAKNLHKIRVILLMVITFSLAIMVFYEILSQMEVLTYE